MSESKNLRRVMRRRQAYFHSNSGRIQLFSKLHKQPCLVILKDFFNNFLEDFLKIMKQKRDMIWIDF